MLYPNDDLDALNEIWGILEDVISSLEMLKNDLKELEARDIDLSIYADACEEYANEARAKQEEVSKRLDQVQRSQSANNVDFL